MDDISPNMDWEKFNRFKALLDAHNIKPLIGVVPDNADTHLNVMNFSEETKAVEISEEAQVFEGAESSEKVQIPEDFWEYVKDLQNDRWTIAMHGMSHVYTTKKGGLFPLNNFSEFAGLDYEEQLELLSYGVDIFNQNGIETDIFMAPAHSYDENTLKALKLLGFSKITDGFGNAPYTYKGMTFYPISFKRSQTLKGGEGFSTFVYHTNEMNDQDFVNFEKFLEEHTDSLKENSSCEVISYSEFLEAPAVARGTMGHLKEYLMARGKHIIGAIRH